MVIDITGEIYNGMWNYEPPFPRVNIRPLPEVDWVSDKVYCEIFEGLHSQTGTYLETPAHFLGDFSYPLIDVPVEKLVERRAVVLDLSELLHSEVSAAVAESLLKDAGGSRLIREDDAVLICCNWGRKWRDSDYLTNSPYFTRAAMAWLISKNPFLIGTDFPRWDNLKDSQGFFPEFYSKDILMLAPCVNLEKINRQLVKLTVLPLKVNNTSCAPCRGVVRF